MLPTLQGGGGAPALQGGSGSAINLQPAAGTPALGVPSTQSAPAPAARPAAAVPSTASSGQTFNAPEYLQGIQQQYEGAIRASQNQLSPLQSEYDQQVGNTNSMAQHQLDDLAAKYNGSMNTLETQKSGTQAQQTLSLAELADRVRGQNQGLMNQLGASGAGFSSAVGQGQLGLAKVQNQQRADINQQTNTNVANINAEEEATKGAYTPEVAQINDWKQGQLYQLMSNFNNTMAQLQGALSTAQGEEKARLAVYGQSLTQQTSDALQHLDAVTSSAINNIHQKLTSAPTPQALPTYQPVAPITIAAENPYSSSSPAQGNATASPVGGSVYSFLDNNKTQ